MTEAKRFRIKGVKDGGSAILDTVVNAIDYADAEQFATNLGWQDVAVLSVRFAPAQYDTPAVRALDQ